MWEFFDQFVAFYKLSNGYCIDNNLKPDNCGYICKYYCCLINELSSQKLIINSGLTNSKKGVVEKLALTAL